MSDPTHIGTVLPAVTPAQPEGTPTPAARLDPLASYREFAHAEHMKKMNHGRKIKWQRPREQEKKRALRFRREALEREALEQEIKAAARAIVPKPQLFPVHYREAARLVAEGKTATEVALALSPRAAPHTITVAAIYRWRLHPRFKAYLDRIHAAKLAVVKQKIIDAGEEAVVNLRQIANNGTLEDKVRLDAALALLRLGGAEPPKGGGPSVAVQFNQNNANSEPRFFSELAPEEKARIRGYKG